MNAVSQMMREDPRRRSKAPSTPATISKQRSTLSKQHSTLLPQTATMSNDSIVKFRPFDSVECCFDIVAIFGNNVVTSNKISFNIVAETGNIVAKNGNNVERIVRLVAFDNVASILLLVWTGLKNLIRSDRGKSDVVRQRLQSTSTAIRPSSVNDRRIYDLML